MDHSPDTVKDRLIAVGEEWADKNAAAQLLEETRKTMFAKMCNICSAESIAAKEKFAYAHEEYIAHVELMVEARRVANRARVKFDSAKVWIDLERSKQVTERQLMGIK